MITAEEKTRLFMSLFKGKDIFARRWEKNRKSGYMPAYDVDWDKYNKHKAKGGNFSNFIYITFISI